MKTITLFACSLLLFALGTSTAVAQKKKNKDKMETLNMKTYLIEREIPGAGDLTNSELTGISQQSCNVLNEMGPEIKWIHSYVTEDKVYCVYQAENKELIEKHAEKAGFPANSIKELSTKISPATALSPDN